MKREDYGYVGSLYNFDKTLLSLPRPPSRSVDVHDVNISSPQSLTQFVADPPPCLHDGDYPSIGMTWHGFCFPPFRWIGSKELDYSPHSTFGPRGPDVKHRTHRFPLGRLTTHLSNEGLAVAVLDGVLIVDPVKRPIGEAND